MRSAESIRMLIHYHLEHARGINTEYQGGGIYYLKAGAEIKMIREATGLSEEEIEKIRREIE